MRALDLVGLSQLMQRTSGTAEITVALVDGPIASDHPDLAGAAIRELTGSLPSACTRLDSAACTHGTFVAGMLCARRGSAAPAICPGCTLLLHPIFSDAVNNSAEMPAATPEALADAIVGSVNAGARVINLSCALLQSPPKGERVLESALDHAARRGAIVVAAAGNQGAVGSSALTRHAWVIPVAACDQHGRMMAESNLGKSIGNRGLKAPGEKVTSLGTSSSTNTFDGTSVAAPFVTGAIALLWSEYPDASALHVKWSILHGSGPRRAAIAPPLLDAWAAYRALASISNGRKAS
jgi:subtilisin family serine protease